MSYPFRGFIPTLKISTHQSAFVTFGYRFQCYYRLKGREKVKDDRKNRRRECKRKREATLLKSTHSRDGFLTTLLEFNCVEHMLFAALVRRSSPCTLVALYVMLSCVL